MDLIRDKIYEKTGGFIKGICHPKGDPKMITDAGINWIRRDPPLAIDKNGNVTESHKRFLEETRVYAENGLRSIVVSPYPREFISNGIDPRTPEGLKKVEEVCEFMAKEYSKYGVCWQATNELFVVHFRAPLNEYESKEFIIASLKGLRKGDPNAIIGHNTVEALGVWNDYIKEIDEKCEYDYLGFDLYNGTWSNGGPSTYIDKVNELYEMCKKPVILMEFGFASLGKNASSDFREAFEYINKLGFKDLDDMVARKDEYIETLPSESLKHVARTCAPEDLKQAFLTMFPHLLKMWFAEEVFPHDEDGQAKFYETLLPMLLESPYLAGAVIYCWKDSKACFTCDAEDCPCETAWGIVKLDDTPKKAYYTIKENFTK